MDSITYKVHTDIESAGQGRRAGAEAQNFRTLGLHVSVLGLVFPLFPSK